MVIIPFFRILFFCGTLALESFYFYSFCLHWSRYQLEDGDYRHAYIYGWTAFVAFLQSMSIICLFRLFCGDPGFVTDNFKSEELTPGADGYPRYAIYSLKDYKKS